MRVNTKIDTNKTKGERGAALITVLMISALLLATGGTLIMVTGMSAKTAIDATAEAQAYYAAEAGMQNSLNVLRGNVAPDASMPAGSKIDFRKAVTLAGSNRPSDSSTNFRLSGWLNYSYTPTGETIADRVPLTANYSPINGLAFSVDVTDPDNTPVASGEPNRLLLRVSGYGPKGARKELELIVNRSNFDYAPPAMLLMVGADNCSAMTFTIGDSNAKDYSGHDATGTGVLPAFGSTCNGDHTIEMNSDGKETVVDPKAQNLTNSDLPPWLRSADDARAFLADQKANAITQGRYFTSYSGMSGSDTDPAFTFVDGNCTLDGGGGLLIVTGNLIMNGNPSFKGLILVLGNGHVERDGGGNGDILGAVTVARFNSTGGFLPPFFDTNGGGTSTMQYDSSAIRQALNVSGPRVMGIHEY